MIKDIRVPFLLLFLILGTGLILFMRQETNRVNAVTDQYLNLYGKNMWLIGCAQGTGDYDKCRALGAFVDFDKLIPEVKKVSQ